MIWLTWRQHRQQALAGALALALLGGFLVLTGRQMAAAYHGSGLAACLAAHHDCSDLTSAFEGRFSALRALGGYLVVLPGLVGLFWGAPLVARELEHHTHRLVWTQSITRRRWITVKLALLLAGTLLVAAPLAWLTTWWLGPLDHATGARFAPGIFDLQGVVPVAYTLFAFALGVAAGTILGRTLPAMAATLVGFLAVRLAIAGLARAHFQPPITTSSPGVHLGGQQGASDWLLNDVAVDRTGHHLSIQDIQTRCPQLGRAAEQCLHALDPHTLVTYQPASRFWLFQGIEATLFTALAAALLSLTIWWVRHRTS
jgi:hypothetical protein